jgi:outer membrane receptor protein involved in Fe transport
MGMVGRKHVLRVLLFTSAAALLPGMAGAQAADQPAQTPDQEPAAETAAEGDAKAAGEDAVPTSEELSPEDPRTLQEIIVTGRLVFRNRTDTVAPELTYDQEFFQKFEPTSVGDSLKRVPGVAFGSDIGEYDAPALRGLGAGFTQILVNWRPIPGGGNDRSVFVDRIPAEIIDRIEIIRSPTADLDSQGIGGTINIILKDGTSLPPGVITRAGLLYYPDTETFKGSGAISVSGRNDAETVAYSITIDAQQRYNPKLTREEVFNDDVPGFEDTETGVDLFRPFDRAGSIAPERVEELDTRRSFDLSFNGDVTFAVGADSKLRFDGFFIRTRRTDTEQTLALERDDIEDPFEVDAIEVSKEPFRQENFGLSALYEGKFGDGWSVESQLRYSQFKERSATSVFELDDDVDLDNYTTNDIRLTDDATLIELDTIRSLDKEITLDASLKKDWGDGSIKVGAVGRHKKREFFQGTGELDDCDDDEDTPDELCDVTEGSGAFDYKEDRLDGFAIAEFKLGRAGKLQAGARAEYTKSRQLLPVPNEDGESRATGSEFHLNPSAHLQLGLWSGGQFRASVARTVRRPNIDQLVPFSDRDNPEDDDITVGNPDLAFETSWGVDIGVEQRIRNGVIGVNFFHRWVDNLIGLVNTGLPADPDDPDSDARIYTFANTGSGKVYGFEFDLSAPLTFIGLDDTGVFANYTRIWSSRTDAATGLRATFDGQPKYVYNFGLTQELPKLGAAFGFSYRKQGLAKSLFFGEEEFQVYGANLEAFVEKRFGKNFVVRLSGNNLLDARSLQWERNFDGDTGVEIIENQRAGNVDAFEVEHEETARQIMLTARFVF